MKGYIQTRYYKPELYYIQNTQSHGTESCVIFVQPKNETKPST